MGIVAATTESPFSTHHNAVEATTVSPKDHRVPQKKPKRNAVEATTESPPTQPMNHPATKNKNVTQ